LLCRAFAAKKSKDRLIGISPQSYLAKGFFQCRPARWSGGNVEMFYAQVLIKKTFDSPIKRLLPVDAKTGF
jgi:hypothetical protein